MANMIKFYRGLVNSLPATGENGALYITTDEGAIYYGTGTGMKRLGDFIQVANVAALPEKAHESCLYYCVAENILAKWNGTEWKQINKQPTAEDLKGLLGLGSLAYKSEVAEGDLNADLKAKVNAAAEGNHSHDNKELLDTYTQTEENLADAVAKKHTHTFTDADVEDAISKEHTHTFADTDVEDAISKKHAHTFNETELNKIASGDVAKWNGVVADHLVTADKTELEDAIGDVNTALENYKTSNNEALAGVKETADAAATKEYTDAELAKKVAKTDYEADKATFATKTELNGIDAKFANYKTAADQKVIDDAQDVEIGKKVDKVDGKDLIATSEIERLATLKNYDDSALAGRVTTAEGKITALETESAKHALKTEVEAVDAKFADYTKTADLPTDLGDFTNNAGYAKTADVNTELDKKADKTQVATDIANAIAPLATTEALNGVKATAEAAAVKTEVDAALLLKADKSVVDAMYTNGQIDTAVQGAKDYAKGLVDAIPAQTDYTVTITEATDGLDAGIAKKYTFTQNGEEIGTINLAKELVVTAGSVKEVAEANKPYAGAVVGDKYIELVIANQEAPIYVPAKDLVDIYTTKDMTGIEGAEIQVAISNTNEISATLVNGGITKEKLADGVQDSLNLADSALQSHQDISHLATKASVEEITKDGGLLDTVEQNAKDYTDDQIEALGLGTMAKEAADDYVQKNETIQIETSVDVDTISTLSAGSLTVEEMDRVVEVNTYGFSAIEDVFGEVVLNPREGIKINRVNPDFDESSGSPYYLTTFKVGTDESVTLSENVKENFHTALDLANTYQAKGDYYTKTEVENLLTWGSF